MGRPCQCSSAACMSQRWMNLQVCGIISLPFPGYHKSPPCRHCPGPGPGPEVDLALALALPWTPFDLTRLRWAGWTRSFPSIRALIPICSICPALLLPPISLLHSHLSHFVINHISGPNIFLPARSSTLRRLLKGFSCLFAGNRNLVLSGLGLVRTTSNLTLDLLSDSALLIILDPQHAIRSTGFYMLSLL